MTGDSLASSITSVSLGILTSENDSIPRIAYIDKQAAAVASATTTDIWKGNGSSKHITGTTTITGFAAAPRAGATRELLFDGAVLLTNGANFLVQGAANYTTSAGDRVFVYADTTTKHYLFISRSDGNQVSSTGEFTSETIANTTLNETVQTLDGSGYSGANNVYHKFILDNDAAGPVQYGSIRMLNLDRTAAAETGRLIFECINSGALTDILIIEGINASFAGSLKSKHATGGVGYGTGAGGAVTQITSKATGVTLNTVCGQITTHNAALAANTAVSFTFTNSTIGVADVVQTSIQSGATTGSYHITVDAIAGGSTSQVTIHNYSGGALGEALVINFAVIKAVAA